MTYFVNRITAGTNQTPYSFVSTLSAGQNTGISQRGQIAAAARDLHPGEDGIIVNEWLASDLGLVPGDTVRLEYFVPGPLRRLEEHAVSLKVEGVVPIEGLFADMNLMPELPGLSATGMRITGTNSGARPRHLFPSRLQAGYGRTGSGTIPRSVTGQQRWIMNHW